MNDETTATVEVMSPFIRVGNCIINTDAIRICNIEPNRFEMCFIDGSRRCFHGEEAELLTAFFTDVATPVEPPPAPVTLAVAETPEAETEPAPAATEAEPEETEPVKSTRKSRAKKDAA